MDKAHTERLFLAIKQGDNAVLETIYVDNRKAFLNFGLKCDLGKDVVLDIYQDAIVAFADNVMNGKVTRLESSVKTYLFSIGKYMIYKKLKQKDHETLPLDMSRLDQYVDRTTTVSSNKKELQLMKKGLEQLGKQCQTVLKLYYFNGLTLEDIQQHLNYSNYNTVKSQKSRCLKHLKDLVHSML